MANLLNPVKKSARMQNFWMLAVLGGVPLRYPHALGTSTHTGKVDVKASKLDHSSRVYARDEHPNQALKNARKNVEALRIIYEKRHRVQMPNTGAVCYCNAEDFDRELQSSKIMQISRLKEYPESHATRKAGVRKTVIAGADVSNSLPSDSESCDQPQLKYKRSRRSKQIA
ncbi:hypothetical protein DFH08DRAFT_805854 [Mycena albidolilacea]|uniref:Uncharacterized protein n=1 Tax=Mycena albidolilacea TaxID=1033008 RepID=A0AAD7A9H8_9AGAR|nr:hypothetical protein DFH08DRAFT_805854 [Mycena albidolilacea]